MATAFPVDPPQARPAENTSRTLLIALGVVFFGYAVLRAPRVSLTIDEAITFNDYVSRGFWGLFKIATANNHILNTLATWLVTRIAGTGVFALRIPNLLGHIAFLVFSIRLLNRHLRGAAAVAGFVVLNANPYVLEFFSLSRGYGISLGLLMASLYYLFRFMDELKAGEPLASRTLAKALGAAGTAVLADMALLFVFLAIVVLAFVVIVHHSRTATGGIEAAPPGSRRRHPLLATGLIARLALINGTNLFRNAYVAERLFADVAVSMSGLTEQERGTAAVFQKEFGGNLENIPLRADGWRFDRPRFVTGLQAMIPEALWAKVTSLEIRIGARPFVFSGPELRALASGSDRGRVILAIPDRVALPRSQFSPMKTGINWNGDGPYLVRLGERALIVVLLFGLFGLALRGAGALAARLRIIARAQSRVLLGGVWLLAAFIAVPIYFLHTGQELYWGGKVGFFHDTLLGLIQDFLYGRSYVRGQEYIVFSILSAAVILFLAAALIDRPIRRFTPSGPALALLALILATWGFFMGERPFFGLPYLLGRTAIFFVPLAVLLFIFAVASFQAHPRLRAAVIGVLAAAAVASAAHFALSANTSFASEWMTDADNKALISDLQAFRSEVGAADRTMRLAVRWPCNPALRYYVRQERLSWLKLGTIPVADASDVYYLDEAFDPGRMVLLKSYPLSGHVLVAPRQ